MLLPLVVAVASVTTPPSTPGPSSGPVRSATIARDLGGFELGMPLTRAQSIADLQPIGNDEFEASKEGVSYHMAVTPAGRIYRISTSQPLGLFTPDEPFLAELRRRLVAKFGSPTSATGETFEWNLNEVVPFADGTRRLAATNRAWAVLTDGGDGVTLDVTLLDFRVLWADQDRANRAPREQGTDRMRL